MKKFTKKELTLVTACAVMVLVYGYLFISIIKNALS